MENERKLGKFEAQLLGDWNTFKRCFNIISFTIPEENGMSAKVSQEELKITVPGGYILVNEKGAYVPKAILPMKEQVCEMACQAINGISVMGYMDGKLIPIHDNMEKVLFPLQRVFDALSGAVASTNIEIDVQKPYIVRLKDHSILINAFGKDIIRLSADEQFHEKSLSHRKMYSVVFHVIQLIIKKEHELENKSS